MTHSHSIPTSSAIVNHPGHYEHDDKKKDSAQHTAPVTFQHPHPNDGIEVKRQAVIGNLREIRDHLQQLRANNWSTHDTESLFDKVILTLVAKAEQHRNPDNHVIAVVNGFDNIQEYLDKPRVTLVTNVPGKNHFVAVDIRNQDDHSSLLVLDSVHAGYYNDEALEAITQNIPLYTKTSIICMETQNSNYGCRIFAMSAASKISKSQEYMNTLHDAHQSPQDESLSELLQSKKTQSKYCADVYQHPGSIPASFLKHTQSRQHLEKHYPQQKEQQVNKKGQTLSERQEDKLVRRDYLKRPSNDELKVGSRIFSASIEDKRLEYLDRCIQYMDQADAQTVNQMALMFNLMEAKSYMPSQMGLQLDQRPLGPYDKMQARADFLNDYLQSLNSPTEKK